MAKGQKFAKTPGIKQGKNPEDAVKDYALAAGRVAEEKLGMDIQILYVGDLMGICDYFVIVSGQNPRQIKTISEAVEEKLKLDMGIKPIYIEGLPKDWLLMDYGDIVVHIFSPQARDYYKLERLWRDCPEVSL